MGVGEMALTPPLLSALTVIGDNQLNNLKDRRPLCTCI